MNPDLAVDPSPSPSSQTAIAPRWCLYAVILAAVTGLALMVDSLWRSSATYDEVTYLEVATHWWRTGDQSSISRMGSPLLFWKLQQAPVLWALDHSGRGAWIDDPATYQSQLLPLARLASLWVWVVALALIAVWSRRLYGPHAMAFSAWIFALSPSLLGHGSLITMELPLLAASTGMFLLFWKFLQTGDRRFFWGTAVAGGLAWSLKYTTVLVPPMLAVVWWLERWRNGEQPLVRLTRDVALRMLAFLLLMGVSNLILTQFAMIPMSQSNGKHPGMESRIPSSIRPYVERIVEIPIPQEIVGFVNQLLQQRGGGLSYLLGERRGMGWWYYYFVALAVKVPLTFFTLVLGRLVLARRVQSSGHELMFPAVMAMFLLITAAASSRNFGMRYLMPIAPLAIVWVSGLAESSRIKGTGLRKWALGLALFGIGGQAAAVASVHPHELTYFNLVAGGPVGGRRVLADSNLDWGQGLKSLVRLQNSHPEFQDLTLYYFGNTEPRYYGVVGTCYLMTAVSEPPDLPPTPRAETPYVAVSASLEWGPWGPEGYFRKLRGKKPLCMTDDHTIAIYRSEDLASSLDLRAN